jgi:hypothetical protein
MKRLSLLTIFFLFSFGKTFACIYPPYEYHVPYYELIERTNNIVLAQVTNIDSTYDSSITYSFKTIEILRGHQNLSTFSLKYPLNQWNQWIKEKTTDNDFDLHRSNRFWDLRGSRTLMESDCILYPHFTEGYTYLVFLGDQDHSMGYEVIKTDDDFWLETVRNVLQSDNFSYRYEMDVFEWFKTSVDAVSIYQSVPYGQDRSIMEKIEQISGENYRLSEKFRPEWGEANYEKYLFTIYHDKEFGIYFPLPIENDSINVGHAQTEIKLTGPKVIKVEDLKEHLQN